jgi:hypothetical protein
VRWGVGERRTCVCVCVCVRVCLASAAECLLALWLTYAMVVWAAQAGFVPASILRMDPPGIASAK